VWHYHIHKSFPLWGEGGEECILWLSFAQQKINLPKMAKLRPNQVALSETVPAAEMFFFLRSFRASGQLTLPNAHKMKTPHALNAQGIDVMIKTFGMSPTFHIHK
jgi:hypothetical protein